MNPVATKEQVESFLTRLRKVAGKKASFYLIPRAVNNSTIQKLGYTAEVVRKEILTLQVQDYCGGPEDDQDRPGLVWIFGKRYGACEVYIKLKVVDPVGSRSPFVKCLSFHEADYRLRYPFKLGR